MPEICEYPFVLGTAGHIDHGKTALVRALSGVDCDRLAEEKKRGITIELGFAPLNLPSGKAVSIVDVPGHERFIRQMAAGAAGIDAVIFVIAADDGIMPQTKEHLDILTLLGIKQGLTVINKIDAVDSETLNLVRDEVTEFLQGSFLSDFPVLEVSALTGEGINDLKTAIDRLVCNASPRNINGPFFMPVDRVFPVSGFGTVVTGTVFKGRISLGDSLSLMPSGITAKVRSIQIHKKTVASAAAGQRAAVNISGVGIDDTSRGDVLTQKGYFCSTECINAVVRVLPSSPMPLEHRQRLHLHVGAAEAVVRISLLREAHISPGKSAFVQLLPERPLTVALNDRFILRTYSPLHTIAGGEVILSRSDPARGRNEKEALDDFLKNISNASSVPERLTLLVDSKKTIMIDEAARLLELTEQEIKNCAAELAQLKKIYITGTGGALLVSGAYLKRICGDLYAALAEFHKRNPESIGMEYEEIASLTGISNRQTFDAVLGILRANTQFKYVDNRIRLNNFAFASDSGFMNRAAWAADVITKAGYSMLTLDEVAAASNLERAKVNEIIAYLRENGEIVIVGGKYILPKTLLDSLSQKLLPIRSDITLSAAREITGCSRKYLIPLLEYMDGVGITRRVGDKRILLKKV